MSRMKHAFVTISIVIFITNIAIASDWREDAKAIDISGGEDHTLILTKNKWAWGCGPNGWYQLGIGGTTESQSSLIRVYGGAMNTPRLQDMNDVDAGWKHSLALEGYNPNDPNYNGYVWSWGDNEQGELGVGEGIADSNVPMRVLRGGQTPADPNNPDPNLARIVDISAGRSGEHSLAVDANGFVYSWGRNQEGQCGVGLSGTDFKELDPNQVLRGEQPLDPNRPSVYLNRIIAVSAGEWHSMALEAYDPDEDDPNLQGRVYTWGDDEFYFGGAGVLGAGYVAEGLSETPVVVHSGQQDPNHPNDPLKRIVAVSAGWDHSMALEKYEEYDPFLPGFDPNHNGRVYTWGNNEGTGYSPAGGRLGDGTTISSGVPVVVLRGQQEPEDPCNPDPNLTRIIAVSAGEGHSMALDVTGCVYCWGDNKYGQLGNGCTDPCTVPVRVIRADGKGYLRDIVAISAGYWHSLAIDANGVIWTWGKTYGGRLGLANIANAPSSICKAAHRIPVVYNETQQTFAFGTDHAIDDANDDDLLVGTWGIYYENVDFDDKSITLESENPNDWGVVAATIIDGQYNTQGTYFEKCAVHFGSGSGSRLGGFTVAEAVTGGIACVDLSSAYISKCVIRDNDWDGIYLDNSSADISRCIIRDNGSSGSDDFYGIYCDDAATTGIKITNNWICGNGTGHAASGIYLKSGWEQVLEDVVIRHNTIADNAGYGIQTSGIPDINNSIIWGNGSGSFPYTDYTVTYSCVEGTPLYSGTGNITSDPCFVDGVNDDYHLTWDSNCVDWGDPNFVEDANETDIDGNPRVMGGRVDMGADEDYPHCDPNDYAEWVEVGRPDCWCYPRQCHGDADGKKQGSILSGYTYVSTNDLIVLADAWQVKEPPKGPGIASIPNGICADFNHAKQGSVVTGYMRVSTDDLIILVNNWQILEPPKGPGIPPDCLSCGGGEKSGSSSRARSELSRTDMLDWLAEIWLDPDVQKVIDAEDWLKLYESVKDLE